MLLLAIEDSPISVIFQLVRTRELFILPLLLLLLSVATAGAYPDLGVCYYYYLLAIENGYFLLLLPLISAEVNLFSLDYLNPTVVVAVDVATILGGRAFEVEEEPANAYEDYYLDYATPRCYPTYYYNYNYCYIYYSN